MAKRVSGAAYAREAGLVSVGLTVTPDDREALRIAAARCGLSSVEFVRRLARWAGGQTTTETGLKKIQKIVSGSLDSAE